MLNEKGVSLRVDSHKRIGVKDVINMLKGLRSETAIKIVKTSESTENKVVAQNDDNENISSLKNTSNKEIESDKLEQYDQNEDHESIESVDFISQPAKKKTIKTKKI